MRVYLCVTVVTTIIACTHAVQVANIAATLVGVPEDGLLTFTDLANKYGLEAEEHTITTEDGYILKLHHIPGDKTRPVLLVHGIFDSSNGFIIRGNDSLAITLAKQNYDVWALNSRGSRYSRNHISYNPNTDDKFWDFSFHERGVYDLAANIDYVLKATEQPKLSIIAFSDGTTTFFALAATQPEYNSKVKLFVALAPVAYVQNTVGPVNNLIRYGNYVNKFMTYIDLEEILGYESLQKGIMNLICTQLSLSYELCLEAGLAPVVGLDSDGIDRDFYPILAANFPAGSSRKNVYHLIQVASKKSFAQYDYGSSKNMQLYRSFSAPTYQMDKVTTNTVLVCGKNDRLSPVPDAVMLKDSLPNVQDLKIMAPSKYNHLDLMWSKDNPSVLFPYLLETLEKY